MLRALLLGLFAVSALSTPMATSGQTLSGVRDAEIATFKFDTALRSFQWDRAAELMHPEALAELKSLLTPLVRSQPKRIGIRFFESDTVEAFDLLSPDEIFIRFMQSVASQQSRTENQDVVGPRSSVIGSVKEGKETVHVIFRLDPPSPAARFAEAVNVRTVKLSNSEWRVMLPRELRSLIAEWNSAMTPAIEDVLKAENCDPLDVVRSGIEQWKQDRNIGIDDAYKWIYQATRGGEHAAPEPEAARQWLEKEWNDPTSSSRPDRLWEPLCRGGQIGRVNIRAYKAAGGTLDELVAAFLASGKEYRGTPDDLISAWVELGTRLAIRPIGKLTKRDWDSFDKKMKAAGYPAVHHSSPYTKAARPAYRIITQDEMARLRRGLPPAK